MSTPRSRHLALVAGASLALSGLGACASMPESGEPPMGPTAADTHRISVTQTGEVMNVPVGAGAMSLSHEARGDLVSFARSYVRWGHGALVLSIPTGGGNADAAARLAQEARVVLAEHGVPYGAIHGALHDGAGRDDAPLLLSFMRFEAVAPECTPLWRQDLAHPRGGNQAYESFGCANVANLAAMIEDPRDLVSPRDEDPRDAARRAVVLERYRQGEQTHAVRTQDERVAISDAVQ
ncbi:MAG: pilus assembly protein CpaD [Alphaproteobacteria bacterium]|nr:pilus assembly protein CpaD [Alphaproteobacteria bacterium]